jgi:hypothetical protein
VAEHMENQPFLLCQRSATGQNFLALVSLADLVRKAEALGVKAPLEDAR